MSNATKYDDFRKAYPEFFYNGYQCNVQPDGLHIAFSFQIGHDIAFRPETFIPARPFLRFDQPKDRLGQLVFNIGMIELISYWKCLCPPTVVVRCGNLSPQQAAFWKKVYFHGLGEFFYLNGIEASIDDFLNFRCEGEPQPAPPVGAVPTGADGYLVPIGGGKDSVVTLELLKANSPTRPVPLIMNPRGATIGCIEAAGYTMDEVLVIHRTIHPRLLELNQDGALNGHTPFSAMLAFYTLLAAQLSGIPNIALSNENSANESTVAGTEVNHQYSKSLEFEDDFRCYCRDFVSPQFNYFSFLRPLSELQIAMLFSRYGQYHDVFRSCNAGSKQDVWCGGCPKCLFAFIILSPFIAPARLEQIFGKNLLNDTDLGHFFDQLTGKAETKPFECVGTISEVHTALALAIARWYGHHRPCLLHGYEPPVGAIAANPLNTLAPRHNLSAAETALLLRRRILIAGYGREGKSSHRCLAALLPWSDIKTAANDQEIFAALSEAETVGKPFDLVVKSPGIPTMKLDGRCRPESITSQTDLFLQRYGAQTIGITGTKGKSTTATLIQHVLATSGRHAVLAGNMGIPLLDIADQLTPDTLVVAEFSCHQLENIHQTPHVSVLLNLYQEHLDHYRDYRGYQMSKMQCILRQQPGDHAICCTDSPDLAALIKEFRPAIASTIHPYSLADSEAADSLFASSPLKGGHNRSNCFAAWIACSLCGVSAEEFGSALATFHGLPHRLELVGTFGGITFYNDSISTIPEAAIAAVEALGEVDTLILGGFDRGIDYSPIVRFLGMPESAGSRISSLVFVGAAGRRIRSLLTDIAGRQVLVEDDYPHIIDWCFRHTRPGHICLLSPAAASYDTFANFEERGDTFKRLIAAHTIDKH